MTIALLQSRPGRRDFAKFFPHGDETGVTDGHEVFGRNVGLEARSLALGSVVIPEAEYAAADGTPVGRRSHASTRKPIIAKPHTAPTIGSATLDMSVGRNRYPSR